MDRTELRAATRRHINRAKGLYSCWRAFAQAINEFHGEDLTVQAVHRWYLTGDITVDRAIQVEEVTKGFVTRAELRPDLYEGYVRRDECANG